jgi:hypothetical protein
VNVPLAEQAQLDHSMGLVTGRAIDKLAVAGLTAVREEHVDVTCPTGWFHPCRLQHYVGPDSWVSICR